MYVAPAFGGFGLIAVPSADRAPALTRERTASRVDRRPGKRSSSPVRVDRWPADRVRTRSLRARPARAPLGRGRLVARHADDVPRAALVRAHDHGLDVEDDPRSRGGDLPTVAVLGIPSGAVVARLGAVRTMLVCDLVRAPLMVAIPVLHAAGALTFPLLLVLVVALGCFLAPYFSAQRVILPGARRRGRPGRRAGERRRRAGTRLTHPARTGRGGPADRRASARPSVLYVDAATFAVSFLVIALLVPQTGALGQAEESGGVLAGLRFVLSDRLLAPILATGVLHQLLRPGRDRHAARCSPTTTTTARRAPQG